MFTRIPYIFLTLLSILTIIFALPVPEEPIVNALHVGSSTVPAVGNSPVEHVARRKVDGCFMNVGNGHWPRSESDVIIETSVETQQSHDHIADHKPSLPVTDGGLSGESDDFHIIYDDGGWINVRDTIEGTETSPSPQCFG